MAFELDEVWVYKGQHLVCKKGVTPNALGLAAAKIDHSTYLQGPVQVGTAGAYPFVAATLMVGPSDNGPSPKIPGAACSGLANPYSLAVVGPAAFMNKVQTNADVAAGGHVLAQGHVISNCGGHVLAAKKNFDIPHPTKEGYRLRHTCPEGPSNDVYFRGRVRNKTVIYLPEYWEKLVDPTTITVSLTPIGAHQDVIVKRIEPTQIHLQAQGGMPINCFFHVYGTRADGERLIPEYEGESPNDYPGNNDEYSVSGYHYDVREG